MMILRAFIQDRGNGRLEPEQRELLAGLRDRGIPSEVFTWKALARLLLPLDKDTLVAGEIPVVIGALKQLGIEPPTPNDYPKCLEPLLHRRVWQSTARALSDDLFDGSGQPVFAKPLGRQKRFTGHVFGTPDDLFFLGPSDFPVGKIRCTQDHCTTRIALKIRHFLSP
jgi:hypothetical protein